jgi:hypothetical protein
MQNETDAGIATRAPLSCSTARLSMLQVTSGQLAQQRRQQAGRW